MIRTLPKITYYRFLYSPSTGEVTLSHNHEGDPAKLPLHSDMAQERQEDDLIPGFAHRIIGGWRIFDQEFNPINDPHILDSVVAAINGTSTQTDNSGQEPASTERLHYGQAIHSRKDSQGR